VADFTRSVEHVTLTIEKVPPDHFCMLVPSNLMAPDDMEPEATQPLLRALFAAMQLGGWLFSDWGEEHGTHCEAWFIPFKPEDADE
jgi:hypothetical protein